MSLFRPGFAEASHVRYQSLPRHPPEPALASKNGGSPGATQNRLATGRKVNSALDDPANFFVSEGLKARASDLSRLLDSMGLGVKTLEAADAGITGLKKLVETAQGLARQAQQTATRRPACRSRRSSTSSGRRSTSSPAIPPTTAST